MKEVFVSETFQDLSDTVARFVEDHEVFGWNNCTIVIEKITDFERKDQYVWRAVLTHNDAKNTMKDLLCEEHEIIRHFWCKDDIRGFETVRPLTEEEVDTITDHVERYVDCEWGINWGYIQGTAENVAPDAFEVDEAEADDENEFKHIESQFTPDWG